MADHHVDPDAPTGGGGPGYFRVPRQPGPRGVQHSHTRVSLVIFPGETIVRHAEGSNSHEVTMGHIYVVGGDGEAYEIAGGPPPGRGSKGPGGHSAGVTPAGHYILGSREHHTTSNWPDSTVPWGAKLRLADDGEIEFFDGTWKRATGSLGVTTQAILKFYQRTPGAAVPSIATLNELAKSRFFDVAGKLLPEWNRNDFGKWSWNLKTLKGSRTPYYIHTTPENEAATLAGENSVLLEQSHGCVHIRPKDRDKMIRKGYLQPGIAVEVRRYGVKGPPK